MRRTWLLLFALVLLPRGAGAQGDPIGPEFQVNTYTTGGQFGASVAADSSGRFVVVWTSQDGPIAGIFGQRYDSGGAPLGPEFRVNTYSTAFAYLPAVAADPSGNFVAPQRIIGVRGLKKVPASNAGCACSLTGTR